ncbi:O-antigen biosynthesis protein WbqP [Marinococcus luteus]|uniref:O-antigen biosynthesis protein WbqP n=1 Tax=Marinococcus luteus TaxID=1122204 RepID=A0A1H2TGX3_9BACI|nr:sugar transferase [Marinococcus luteus]SDW42935.1 O-antigen biosynthesis protein WbqP [Marinococcus luteus]
MKKYSILKKIIDFDLTLIATIALMPLIVVLSLLIKLDSNGPILFKQKRIGKDKVPFYILKFRTMKIDTPRDTPTHMLENPESYITNMGVFLRKTSLDELPQLFNILKSDMSLVGPRPALWNQYDLIEERDKYKANAIEPGLTGWAQVNGRDELPIGVKARLDGEYASKRSLTFDLKILIKTFLGVLKSDGIKEGKADS